jgi:hypothetical protein
MGPVRAWRTPLLWALVSALLCSLGHWVILAKNHGDYTPFAVSPPVSSISLDETTSYAPAARRFMTTGRLPAEVDDHELRAAAAVPFLPLALLGAIGRLFGSLDAAFIAADVIFPAIAFGLFYAISSGVVASATHRAAASLASLFIPFGPRNFFWSGYDALLAKPDFARTPQPEVSLVVLLAAATLTARALRTDRKAAAVVVSAAVIYCYYFYAIAWLIALTLAVICAFIYGRRQIARRALIILGGTILLGSPYFAVGLIGQLQGGQGNLLARVGAKTHAPYLPGLALLLVGAGVLWRFGRDFLQRDEEWRERLGVLCLLALAGVAGLNAQVLTGYDAQHTHYWNRLVLPLAALIAACAGFRYIEKAMPERGRLFEVASLAISILLVANVGVRQIAVAELTAPSLKASRPEVEILDWTARNTAPGEVIGALSPNIILLTPALTADYAYVPFALRSLDSDADILDRYLQLALACGVTPERFAAIARAPGPTWIPSYLAYTLGRGLSAQAVIDAYGAARPAGPASRPRYPGCVHGRAAAAGAQISGGEDRPSQLCVRTDRPDRRCVRPSQAVERVQQEELLLRFECTPTSG